MWDVLNNEKEPIMKRAEQSEMQAGDSQHNGLGQEWSPYVR